MEMDGGDPVGTLRALVSATEDPGGMTTQDKLDLADEVVTGRGELEIMLRILQFGLPMGGDYVFLSNAPAETEQEREWAVAVTEDFEVGYLNARHPGPYKSYTGRSFTHAARITIAEGSRLVRMSEKVASQPKARLGGYVLPAGLAEILGGASDSQVRRAKPRRRDVRVFRVSVGTDGSVSIGASSTTRKEIVAARRGKDAGPAQTGDPKAEAIVKLQEAKLLLARGQSYEAAAIVRHAERQLLGIKI